MLFIFLFSCVNSVFGSPFDDIIFRVNFAGNNWRNNFSDSSVDAAAAINFIKVPELPNGNGCGALFNGTTSGINYGLGDSNELKLGGAFTQHIRLSFGHAPDMKNT